MARGPLLRVLAPLLFLLALADLLLSDGVGGGAGAGLSAAFAVAAGAFVCALIGGGRTALPVPPTRVRTALRDRARRTAFLPQRDPDAPGRRRPRAPGRPLLTAA
ncbi:DUF6412 domain-containing protein [Streptomyces sp. NPDC048623]|uniref:DUF6412 domain-containing protein n=1 Tax=Streptomyces sp. NPDC048623 TaxID=3155761 RepID=UPI003414F8FF